MALSGKNKMFGFLFEKEVKCLDLVKSDTLAEVGVLTDVSVLVKEIFVDSVRVFEQSSSIDGGVSVWEND